MRKKRERETYSEKKRERVLEWEKERKRELEGPPHGDEMVEASSPVKLVRVDPVEGVDPVAGDPPVLQAPPAAVAALQLQPNTRSLRHQGAEFLRRFRSVLTRSLLNLKGELGDI